jgi:hypothetical protein
LTKIGSKWSKKKKILSEVRESKPLNKEIEDDRSTRKDQEDVNECFGAPHEKEGKIGW